VTSSFDAADRTVAPTATIALPTNELADRCPPADGESETSTPQECVGPIALPADLTRALRALAADAGTDGFVPLAICAWVLAGRLSRLGAARRFRMIQGPREVLTPASAPPADGLRVALRRAGELRVVTAPDDTVDQRVDVTLLVSEDGRRLYAESMTSSADAPTALCLARSFVRLLTGVAADPDAPMAAHPLIDRAERDRILHGLNPYRRPDVRYRTMAEPFEEQADRTPEATALVDEHGRSVGYRELNQRANRLAHFLRRQGAGRGTRIGICLERGIDQIVAIYAAVKTGAAYVPLDAEAPDSRLGYILSDAAPRFVLTDPARRARIPEGDWHIVDVEATAAPWADAPTTNPAVEGSADDLVHILYTSGTTGRPKGVAYPTSGAIANLVWLQGRYPFGPGDCAVFQTSPGFDVSIWEIFWPLYHGARLVICRPGGHRDPTHIARLIADHGVTTMFMSPTVMAPYLEAVPAHPPRALTWAFCGGEPMTTRIWRTFSARLPDANLINCYGPTEAGSVVDMVLGPNPDAPVVPLGRPADNFRVTLLDENLDLVPVGMSGEAYLGGEIGLAHAYWRAPGLTAERFVADPYGPPGSRLYRTGDLCRYRDDGVLEHLGRIDRQIKIRGLRVEPGEIEAVLAAHPAVGDCAVIAHGSPVRLLAFVVPAARIGLDEVDLVAIGQHAASLLPVHMRPERVVPVRRIPTTVNGKIDNAALIDAWQAMVATEREIVPPADDLEAALVDIYRRVLDTETVSTLDTFAQLGGHSLLAFKVLDECVENLHARPDAAEVLGGTVRDVAASIRAARGSPDANPRGPDDQLQPAS
jgi:amino acid adenylation domain-containing protein